MDAHIDGGVVEFKDADGKLCGTYHYSDPYISFFRGLLTPSGRDVVAFPPPDHPHHKGLQYGLCLTDVNFWEEKPDPPQLPAVVGRQQTTSMKLLNGGQVGFSQEIVWRDDVKESFHESRVISLQRTAQGYEWTWDAKLTASRDVVLIKGPWAARDQDGLSVGYYGLGVRLAEAFFTENSQLFIDGNPTSVFEGLGQSVPRVALQGTGVQVMFEQTQTDPLYINVEGFIFMGLGAVPTTVAERPLAKGESLMEHYVITVSDL